MPGSVIQQQSKPKDQPDARSAELPCSSKVEAVDFATQDTACRVNPLSPRLRASWDQYVSQHPLGTLFHTLAWHDAVHETFGHDSFYLIAQRGNKIVGVLPMFRVISRLAGRLLVSMPYAVGGGIIADDDEATSSLYHASLKIAQRDRIDMIDFRSEQAAIPDLPVIDRYAGFSRELPNRVDEVMGLLPRKARAAARNARNKYNLKVSFSDEHLKKVWELYTISMRRLGSLSYPYLFFKRLIEHTPDQHWVSIVYKNEKPVAGLVTFLYQDRVLPYFFGSNSDATQCSAANYVYLTAMERGVEEGFQTFDFGRSRLDNTGSYGFKKNQGFEPRTLGYQCYVPQGCTTPNMTPSNPKIQVARKIWSHLPLAFTKFAGAKLAKHLPG